MAYTVYRDHTIVSSAMCDQVSGKWKLAAFVTWPAGESASRVQFLKSSPEVFSRFEDAVNAGIETSKCWVDNKLRQPPYN